MTFWELVFEHPWWVTLWLVIVWAILPTFNFKYSWKRPEKKLGKPAA